MSKFMRCNVGTNSPYMLDAFYRLDALGISSAYAAGESAIDAYNYISDDFVQKSWPDCRYPLQVMKDLALVESIEEGLCKHVQYFLYEGASVIERIYQGKAAIEFALEASFNITCLVRQAYLVEAIETGQFNLIPKAMSYRPSTVFFFEDGSTILDKVQGNVSETMFLSLASQMLIDSLIVRSGSFFFYAYSKGGNINSVIVDSGMTLTDYALTHNFHPYYVDFMLTHGGYYNPSNFYHYCKELLIDGVNYERSLLVDYAASNMNVNFIFLGDTRIVDYALDNVVGLDIVDCLLSHGGTCTRSKLLSYYNYKEIEAVHFDDREMLSEVVKRKIALGEDCALEEKVEESGIVTNEEDEAAATAELAYILSGAAKRDYEESGETLPLVGDKDVVSVDTP